MFPIKKSFILISKFFNHHHLIHKLLPHIIYTSIDCFIFPFPPRSPPLHYHHLHTFIPKPLTTLFLPGLLHNTLQVSGIDSHPLEQFLFIARPLTSYPCDTLRIGRSALLAIVQMDDLSWAATWTAWGDQALVGLFTHELEGLFESAGVRDAAVAAHALY